MYSSATAEALKHHRAEHGNGQVYPMSDTSLRPTHTLSPSQSSTVTYTSTVNLVEKPDRADSPASAASSLCCGRRPKNKASDTGLPLHGKKPARKLDLFMGWKLIFFGSCEYCMHCAALDCSPRGCDDRAKHPHFEHSCRRTYLISRATNSCKHLCSGFCDSQLPIPTR